MIICQNINKQYGEETIVLKALNLMVAKGECLFIRGVSGSGKTTLLNLMALLDEPSSGTITFEGQDLHALSANQQAQYLNEKVGIIFQKFNLLSQLTVIENVMLPRLYQGENYRETEQLAQQILDELAIGHLSKRKPSQLSGGQQQRVAVARVLLQAPEVIMADEPSANVDEATENLIVAQLAKQKAEGKTLVIVSHNQIYETIADRVLYMRKGELFDV
ncbi:MAG: ABC transporter ATP-binding protein [Culicoidibacterales bacterium]